jgi:glycosyltransferase involved in cell wall biosynthesis
MRIALITDGIWPYVLGGMQKHSFYLCKYLAQNKVEVHLFHFNQSQYDIAKLEFFTAEERQYIHATVIDFPVSASFPGHYIYNSHRYSKLVYAAIKERLMSYDFIYSKGFTAWYLIQQKYKQRIACPRIGIKFHGYEMFQKAPNFKIKLQHLLLLRWPVKSLSRKADVVFSYGGKITDIIQSIGVEASKIIELPSGVEEASLPASVKPVEEKIKFLFLGRYERRKGIEELNEAIQTLYRTQTSATCEFHFIGPISKEKQLSLKQLVYHGEIRDRKTLQTLMQQFDILICPSWSEGMPNVILEAMANGLAVMATDVGATNVLVSAQTGWLLKSSSPAEITNTLKLILKLSPDEINLKKQAAQNLIREQFVWEKLIVRLLNTIKQ